jgi:hypothetical protein
VGKLRLICAALSQHFIAAVAEYAVVEVPHVNDVDAWQNICFGRQAQARAASCQQNNGAEVTNLTAEVCVKLMALTPVRHWLSLLCNIYTGRTVQPMLPGLLRLVRLQVASCWTCLPISTCSRSELVVWVVVSQFIALPGLAG